MMPSRTTLLLVSPHADHAGLVQTALDHAAASCAIHHYIDLGAARAASADWQAAPDRVLLVALPAAEIAPDVVLDARSLLGADMPVIALVEADYEAIGLQAVRAGAQDYLTTEWLGESSGGERLVHALTCAIERQQTLARARHEIEALRSVEFSFRNFIDHNVDGMVLIDRDGIIRFVNPTAAGLFGRAAEELTGALFGLPLAADGDTEIQIVRPDGSLLPVEMRTVEAGWRGEPAQLAVLHDITQRMAWEEERRKLSRAVQQSGSMVFITNRQGEIEYVNPKFTEITGYTFEDIRGKNPRLLQSGVTQLDVYQELWRTITAGGEWRGELHNRKRNGDLFWVLASISAIKDSRGQITHFLAIEEDITARKLAENTLRQSEARFRAIFEDAAVGISLTDDGGRFLDSNRALQTMLGYSRSELQHLTFVDVTHPDDVDYNRALFNALQQGERYYYQIEKRYLRKDGSVVWGRLTVSRVRIPDSDTTLSIGMVEDITKRKQAEEAEMEQRALANALRDAAAALSSTLNLDDVLERLLTDIRQVVPYDAADIMLLEDEIVRIVRSHGYLARGLEDWIADFRLHIHGSSLFEEVIETQQPVVIADTHSHPDWVLFEEIAWIRSHVKIPIRLENRVIGFLNIDSEVPDAFTKEQAELVQIFADQAAIAIWNAQLYDAVRRHASELEQRVEQRTAEMEQERAQLQAILDAMGEGVTYVDQDNRARYINRAYSELAGYSSDETLPEPGAVYDALTSAIEDRDGWLGHVDRTIARGDTWRGEIQFQRKDGSQFDAGVTVTAVRRPDGVPIGRVELIRDISQEKALQDQKDRFIANASHELRTPLTNVKMRLYLLRKQPHRLDDHLPVIEEVTDRMQNLVDELLDLSRFERGVISLRRRDTVLQELLDNVVTIQRPHAQQKDIRVELQLPPRELHVLGDSQRLTQVFTNLITNAINYTPENGTIAVRLFTGMDEDRLQPCAVVQVTDTGVGIAPELLPHIFEPFFRATDSTVKGTGLGLSITREIVDLHGGTLSVHSEPGRGSTFSVRLALLDAPPSPDA